VLQLQRLAAEGLAGRFGLYEAIDYTPARLPRGQASVVVARSWRTNQGMILLSLAHLLLSRPMQRRFESDRCSRRPCCCCRSAFPRLRRSIRILRAFRDSREFRRRRGAGARDRQSGHAGAGGAAAVERQVPRHGHERGRGSTRWKDLAVTRWREDSTCDSWGTSATSATCRAGSSGRPPTSRRSSARPLRGDLHRVARRIPPADNDFESHIEIVVSPEDDIELRRLRITNRSPRAPGRSTSRATRKSPSRRQPPTSCTRRSPTCSCRRTSSRSSRPSCARAAPARTTRRRPGCSTSWPFTARSRWTCPTRRTAWHSSDAGARQRRRRR